MTQLVMDVEEDPTISGTIEMVTPMSLLLRNRVPRDISDQENQSMS